MTRLISMTKCGIWWMRWRGERGRVASERRATRESFSGLGKVTLASEAA